MQIFVYISTHRCSVPALATETLLQAGNSVICKEETIPSSFSAFVYFCLFVSGGQWFWLSGRPLNLDREEQRKGGEGGLGGQRPVEGRIVGTEGGQGGGWSNSIWGELGGEDGGKEEER